MICMNSYLDEMLLVSNVNFTPHTRGQKFLVLVHVNGVGNPQVNEPLFPFNDRFRGMLALIIQVSIWQL